MGNKHTDAESFIDGYMTYGWKMVCIRPPHSHHWHLSIYPTMAQRLGSGAEYIFQVSVAKRWQCVISALVANCLPDSYFLRHSKRCKSLGPYCQSHLWLAVALWMNGHGPYSLQSQTHAQQNHVSPVFNEVKWSVRTCTVALFCRWCIGSHDGWSLSGNKQNSPWA